MDSGKFDDYGDLTLDQLDPIAARAFARIHEEEANSLLDERAPNFRVGDNGSD
jgi:hypothetical protein